MTTTNHPLPSFSSKHTQSLAAAPSLPAIELSRLGVDQTRHLLNVTEAASALGVTRQHIIGLIELGRIEAIDVSKTDVRHYWRIPVDSFGRFIQQKHSLITPA